jgi:hypothetical protein
MVTAFQTFFIRQREKHPRGVERHPSRFMYGLNRKRTLKRFMRSLVGMTERN